VIELLDLSKAYAGRAVLDRLSLRIERGELLVLLGRSGSGKSTLLKLMNRLVEPDSGRVLFDGRPIAELPVEALRRRIGYVIQDVGLFPHWSVARNIATVPTLLRWPKERIARRVEELLQRMGLDPAEFGARWPHQLSGGQQQRVGVARALAAEPELLLMDEPFGALDPLTRTALQADLARLHAESGQTIVFVTHDVDEALRLATRIVLLDAGRIVQQGPPAQLLAQPADARVRSFMGGGEAGLRLLALQTVASRMRRGEAGDVGEVAQTIAEQATLREALALCAAQRIDKLAVTDATGRRIGLLHMADLFSAPP
jgi:osmoprotectant transport system ATP-binding protein